MSYSNNDAAYSHWIAQKAVARAALHVGIESMSQEALETLGDVLLEYLGRIGDRISVGVEASGRSSAHVNVMDAIRAIEVTDGSSWSDLADFTLGPEWWKEQEPTREATGGKGLGVIEKKGWNAPYPDQLDAFPTAKRPYGGINEEDFVGKTKDTEEEKEIPDSLFTREWGQVAKDDEIDLDALESPEKKMKVDTDGDNETADRPLHIPMHFPKYPDPSASLSRTIVDLGEDKPQAKETKATGTVRTALVELGKHSYWGSAWTEEDLEVTAGPSKNLDQGPRPQIVPLTGPSGSTVSRILEGSLDAATMQ